MAIGFEVGEVEVARALEVHRHAVDHRLEVLLRQAVGRHHRHQRPGHRVLRRAGVRGDDLGAPPRELAARDARVGDLVDDVVDFAAERVQRGDRASPFGRQEQEAVVEARAAAARRAAGSTRRGSCRRGGAQVARPRKEGVAGDGEPAQAPDPRPMTEDVAARPPRCRRGCGARPPARRRVRDRAASRRARVSGRPDSSRRRARVTSKSISACHGAPQRPAPMSLLGHAVVRRSSPRQVDASALPVRRHVLPEVDELQRAADRVAPRAVRRRVRAVEVQQQAPDRIGRAPAVVLQRDVVGVAGDRDVLAERGQQVAEGRRAAGRGGRWPPPGPGTAGRAESSARRSRRSRVRSAAAPPGAPRQAASPSSARSSALRAKR